MLFIALKDSVLIAKSIPKGIVRIDCSEEKKLCEIL